MLSKDRFLSTRMASKVPRLSAVIQNLLVVRARLHRASAQRCDDASNTALIGNKGVAQKWVATQFWSTLFSMRTVLLASSQSCRSVDTDARCKRVLMCQLNAHAAWQLIHGLVKAHLH